MKRLITSAGLVLAGMLLGWWLRDAAPSHLGPLQAKAPSIPTNTQVAMPSPALPLPIEPGAKPNAPLTTEATASPESARFEQLLHEQAFVQALAYYENALNIDEGYRVLLKPALEGYLQAGLHQCTGGAFVELVDLWLDAYYDDIPVLLLLAENQRLCSSPEEAARTLQLARAYAIQLGAQGRVNEAVSHLIATTDDSLSQQKNWIALLGFFEFLQVIDLATNGSELRRAALYQVVGEHQRSRDLLLQLREQDDGSNAQWTAALNQQWGKSATESGDNDPPAQAIPLTRRGDHFLVSTIIDDGSRVVLVLDTGASVTTLSRNSFKQIDSSEFRYRGSQLFNTPNGVTQGEVYQTSSITLGNTRLNAVEIAVLDYESADGVDGLLGMNVLRNYRFEIDQDQGVLYLHPR